MALIRKCLGFFRSQPPETTRIVSIDSNQLQQVLQDCKNLLDKENVSKDIQICLQFLKEAKEQTLSYAEYKNAASYYTIVYRLMLMMLSISSVAVLFELSMYLGIYQLCLALFNMEQTASPKISETFKKIQDLSKEINADLAAMDKIVNAKKLDIHFDIPKKDARAFVHAVVDKFGPKVLIDTKDGPAAVFPGWIGECLEWVGADGRRHSLQELSDNQYSQTRTLQFAGRLVSFDPIIQINARNPCFLIDYNLTHPIKLCNWFSQLCAPFRANIYPSVIRYKTKIDAWAESLIEKNQKIMTKYRARSVLEEEMRGYSDTSPRNHFLVVGSIASSVCLVFGGNYFNSLTREAKMAHEKEMGSANSLQYLQGAKKQKILTLCEKLGFSATSCSIKALELILDACAKEIIKPPVKVLNR